MDILFVVMTREFRFINEDYKGTWRDVYVGDDAEMAQYIIDKHMYKYTDDLEVEMYMDDKLVYSYRFTFINGRWFTDREEV